VRVLEGISFQDLDLQAIHQPVVLQIIEKAG